MNATIQLAATANASLAAQAVIARKASEARKVENPAGSIAARGGYEPKD